MGIDIANKQGMLSKLKREFSAYMVQTAFLTSVMEISNSLLQESVLHKSLLVDL